MSDLDLAALTEAVHARLAAVGGAVVSWSMDEDGEPTERDDFVSGSLTAVVRAVLEALPREWGARLTASNGRTRWVWLEHETLARDYVDASRRSQPPGHATDLVWRAVGPPIPAEDA